MKNYQFTRTNLPIKHQSNNVQTMKIESLNHSLKIRELKIENSKLKRFVNEFNFPEPDWSILPNGFPKLSKKGLTKQERHLLDGIKLAWVVTEGRETLYKTTAKRVFVGLSIVIFVLLGRSLLVKSENSITKNVQAKTVSGSVEEFVEATMSAVFRK